MGLGRAAEVRRLSTRRWRGIARRRSPRQWLLTGQLRCAGDRLELGRLQSGGARSAIAYAPYAPVVARLAAAVGRPSSRACTRHVGVVHRIPSHMARRRTSIPAPDGISTARHPPSAVLGQSHVQTAFSHRGVPRRSILPSPSPLIAPCSSNLTHFDCRLEVLSLHSGQDQRCMAAPSIATFNQRETRSRTCVGSRRELFFSCRRCDRDYSLHQFLRIYVASMVLLLRKL
jgi:hypothetical protein